MKKLIVYLIAAIVGFSGGYVIAGQSAHEQEQEAVRQWKEENPQYKTWVGVHPDDYNKWKGYQPKYNGIRTHHPENYSGHWQSWDEWEKYYKENRSKFNGHKYYRNDGSLYVRYQTEDGTYVFSIGR
jgi:hypothetical protein